jgi:quercetin dioxygenase-like cupin family protein
MRTYVLGSVLVFLGALTVPARTAMAQTGGGFGICIPRSQRASQSVGCFIVGEQPIGVLDGRPVFWYVSQFPTLSAARAASPRRGTVIDAFDSVWLMVIGDSAARPPGGTVVAAIGPLPIAPGTAYSALFMEASMRPGMQSAIHRHSGPEAWYTLSGQTCLETPTGVTVGRAGGTPVVIPGDVPMQLTATGTGIRRSLVLILHDSSKPPTTMETRWTPRNVCR